MLCNYQQCDSMMNVLQFTLLISDNVTLITSITAACSAYRDNYITLENI